MYELNVGLQRPLDARAAQIAKQLFFGKRTRVLSVTFSRKNCKNCELEYYFVHHNFTYIFEKYRGLVTKKLYEPKCLAEKPLTIIVLQTINKNDTDKLFLIFQPPIQ